MRGVFNIGSNRETKIVDLAYLIRELVGSESPIVHVPYRNVFGESFEETHRRVPDVRHADEVLGFRAEVPLDEGLQKTVAWFQRAWPQETLAPGRNNLAGFFDPSERE